MSKLFSYNAFATLGVDTSSSQKEVIKQSKKIIVILQNDEEFDYDYDLGSINKVTRTEASVNNAVQRLSSPIKRIKEYFFWFEIENDEDVNNLKLLKDSKLDEALDSWKERAKKSNTAKRNLAIASSILLNHTGYKKYAKYSIDSWKDILDSDKFWDHFEKVYELNDEVGTSKTALNDFREKVLDYLSDFYTDVSRNKKDSTIYAAFNSAFGVKGQKMQDEVLGPIFEQINKASEQLSKLNASQDNVLSNQEKITIKKLSKKIQDLFQEIKNLGLYEDSLSKVMRDKAAEAINIVAIDLYNNLNETDRALALLKISKSFAAGPKAKSLINKNYEYIKQVLSHDKITDPINNLIEKEEYQEALVLLNTEQHKNIDDNTLHIYFTKRIQWCVNALASRDFEEAEKLFVAKDYVNAEYWFNAVYEFIYSYIEEFKIDKVYLDENLVALNNKLTLNNFYSAEDINNYRQQILDNSNLDKDLVFELPIIIKLVDCMIYIKMSQQLPVIIKKNKNDRINNLIWKFIIWGVIIGGAYLFFSSGSSESNTSSGGSTSSNTAYQTCKTEYDSLMSQLNSVDNTMNSYDTSGNTEAYNNLVPQQNSLVNQVNNKATECNNLR